MSELVTIARFRDLPQAELARGKLESEGISAFLANRYLVGVNWNFSFAVGGIRLQVASEDAAEAQMILEAFDSSSTEASKTARFDWEDSCPSCGSNELRQIKLGRKSAAISILLNLPLLFWGTRLACRRCGHTWRPARSREPFPDIPPAVDANELESSIGEKTWRDDVPWVIFFLMCVVAGYMLYEYTK